MRIYVRREYGTDGPYSLEQLQEMLDSSAVTFNDTVWVEGTENWVPLNQVEGIYLRPAPEPGSALVEEGLQTRPWVRYWARSIDSLLIGIAVAVPVAGGDDDPVVALVRRQLVEGVADAAAALDPRVHGHAVAERTLLDRLEHGEDDRRLSRLGGLERHRQRTGTVPRSLSEAGTRVEGMAYEALGSDAWRLVGTNGSVELTLSSHDSLPRFLGNSFEVISRRPR